jgi:hypothetical protein
MNGIMVRGIKGVAPTIVEQLAALGVTYDMRKSFEAVDLCHTSSLVASDEDRCSRETR